MNLHRILVASLAIMAASGANAVTSITQKNIQVPTTGTLAPGDFLTDGTNIWFGMDLYDGTTWATFNADGGLAVHLNNSSVAVTGTFWQTTQPVSAASLPLPTGAATSALQTTGNTALAAIEGTPSAYGTPPSGNVIGVNAFVTNTNTNLTPGDAITTTTYGAASPTIGAPLLWNGTTYDRWKEGSATGVGLISLTGTLPAFASNPTIANTAFGISGTLPAFASIPTVALNTTPSLANGNGVVPTQGGAVLSATNGGYQNVLQGNAALSATNGLPIAPSPYPAGAVPITASATGTTAATTATLTAVAGHTTYICGLSIRANATAAATGNATVTGTISGTLNFTQWTAPNASGVGVTEIPFAPCVPASAVTTNIAVVSAAPGTGGVVSVTAWGYSI